MDEADREVERATHTSRFSDEQIIGILRLAEAGQTVAEVRRQPGIGEGTYYRWKAPYSELEEETRRLKRIVADLTLDNAALKEIATKKTGDAHRTTRSGGPSASDLRGVTAARLPSRRGAHRRTVRYQRRMRSDELRVRERLHSLARERSRWGYRQLHILLQRELG